MNYLTWPDELPAPESPTQAEPEEIARADGMRQQQLNDQFLAGRRALLNTGADAFYRKQGEAAIHAAPPVVERLAPSASPPPKAAETPPPAQPNRQLTEIKSPTVGTFYAQEKPGSPPYVTVGSRVTPTTIVCQIEAMKLFNEITADCSGALVEVCVQNKEFVEYGTVLFRVDPNG